jgi:hypothetical protein
MLRRISVETRFKGYRYFGIERDFFNNLGVLDARIQRDSLQKKHFDIDCLYHRQGNEQKQVAVHQRTTQKCTSVTIFVMFFVGRLILRELHFIYNNKQYMFLIVKAFATKLKSR